MYDRFVKWLFSKEYHEMELRSLASAGIADDLCPNCVTPWKCNGPHLTRR